MASKVTKPSLIKSVSQRGYAAAAAAQQSYALPVQEHQVTTLPSGTVVASLENNAPVSKVALFFKAGSRFETPATLGASHMARLCAGTSTKQFSAFHITRALQQNGGGLAAEGGREHVGYVVDINRDHLDEGLGLLTAVGTGPVFKPWEVAGQTGRLKAEIASLDSSAVVLDLLHSAAFRGQGLGNSIYVPSHKVGGVSQAALLEFAAATHTAGGMAIVGLGVEHDALISYAKGLGISGGAAAATGGYGGAEIRHETGGPITTVAVAGEGGSIGSGAAAAVAQYILGTGPSTKYGGNASSKLAGVVAAAGGAGAASAISASYSDSGLLGYFVVAESAAAGSIVSAVHDAVKNLAVTEADVAAAKLKLKAAILMASESQTETVLDMGLQALLTGGYAAPAATTAAVDAVTVADVEAALGKAFGGKLSMAAVGSLSGLPYLDQL
ncbi:unnamed protein product [Meganyctiphanes norvegica]|uniref:Peptidase M16 N-terminal domain-containing protein n=1 Tax=Meganyctiphanes norvegica TaxID=48144 RepID=A0AAV2QAB3_MEGNR